MVLVEPKSVSAFVRDLRKFYRRLCKSKPIDVIQREPVEVSAKLMGILPKVPYEFNHSDKELVFRTAALFATQTSPVIPVRGRVQVVCILDNEDKPVYVQDWLYAGKSHLVARGFVLTSTVPSDIGKVGEYLLHIASFCSRRRNPYAKFEHYRLSGGFCFSNDSVHLILPKGNWFFKRNILLQSEEFENVKFSTPEAFIQHFVGKEE